MNYGKTLFLSSRFGEISHNFIMIYKYRLSHLLIEMGSVDFDLGVRPSCLAAQPLLPNSHQPKQNQADCGTIKIQVNPTQSKSRWDTLYCCEFIYFTIALVKSEETANLKIPEYPLWHRGQRVAGEVERLQGDGQGPEVVASQLRYLIT